MILYQLAKWMENGENQLKPEKSTVNIEAENHKASARQLQEFSYLKEAVRRFRNQVPY